MKKFLSIFILSLVATGAYAQADILNAKSSQELSEMMEDEVNNNYDEPLPYGYVAERDILWKRTVWEKIDLDERVNFPLYYPVDTVRTSKNRRSLYHVLIRAAKSGDVKLFEDSYFNYPVEVDKIETYLQTEQLADRGTDILNEEGIFLEPGEKFSAIEEKYGLENFSQYVQVTTISAADVKEYHVRGIWYFDTKQSELRYRMIGIAPVTPDVNIKAGIITDPTGQAPGVELFWVYFPEAREILHKAKAFNNLNSARPISFDHILNSRRFAGTIYKVDNVQGDRAIERYIADNSMMQLLEAERLKEDIRNFELDMWNY